MLLIIVQKHEISRDYPEPTELFHPDLLDCVDVSVQFDLTEVLRPSAWKKNLVSSASWLWDSSVLIFNYCHMDRDNSKEEEKRAEARPCG